MEHRGPAPDGAPVWPQPRPQHAVGEPPKSARYLVEILLFALAYLAIGQLGRLAVVSGQAVSSAWLPAGLAVAVLLRFGPRLWPGVALGAFVTGWVSLPITTAAGIALGSTLQAATGCWLLQRAGFNQAMARLRDVALLVTLSAIESTLVSASIGATVMVASGIVAAADFPRLWLTWWSGNALGVLLLAPLALLLIPPLRDPVPRGRVLEGVAVLLLLVAATNALLGLQSGYQYMMFPVAGWAAVRFGPRGAAVASMVVAGLAVWHTLRGSGPFGTASAASLQLLQAYLALLAVASLVLAAAIAEREGAQQDARDGEKRLADAQALAQLGSWTWDVATQTIWWSDEMCRIAGVPPRGSPQDYETVMKSVPPEDLPRVNVFLETALRTGQRMQQLGRLIRPDGTARILDGVVQPRLDAEGKVIGLLGTCYDITDREDALHQLRLSERRFRSLVETSPDAIISVTPEGELVSVNQGFERMLGWKADEWRGRNVGDLVHPDDRGHAMELFQRAMAGDHQATPLDLRLLSHSGSVIIAEGVGVALMDEGRVTGGMAVLRDVTGRRRAEEALRASRGQLRALSQRQLGLQEMERTRIARDLHDQIGQVLSAVAMNLENLLSRGRPERRHTARIHESLAAIDQAIEQVRTISFDLRPALLDDLGLPAAVAEYCRRQAERAELSLVLDIEAPPAPLPKEVETACFRVLQEAVTNTLRHARAAELDVTLRVVGGVLSLVVRDDGIGFGQDGATNGDASSHLGIVGMQERAELVGGRVDVESSPDDGTAVLAHFPLGAEVSAYA